MKRTGDKKIGKKPERLGKEAAKKRQRSREETEKMG